MSPLSLLTSPRGQAALGYLPPLYERSRVMQSVLQAHGVEMDALRQVLDETLDQFFARTATWWLDRWEYEMGLSPAPDQPDPERRDRIVSRIRGRGTCTVVVVKAVAESYDQGEVEVSEQPALYRVTIEFVDTRGVPPNIDDLRDALRAVVPAHLDVLYQYRYTLWNEVKASAKTWDQVKALGITWEQLKTHAI